MNIGIIFAGGSGRRMHTNGVPKQFLNVEGKPIIVHTLEHFELCKDVDTYVVVCIASHISYMRELVVKYNLHKTNKIVIGGNSGQESIYNGLCAAREISDEKKVEDAVVIIHDGVRPLITSELISANIRLAREKGNAITVSPAIETIFRIEKDTKCLAEIFDRSSCYLAKAPQTFWLNDIWRVHEEAKRAGKEYIDSASLMKAYGYNLYAIESTPDNIKVTTPSDYYMLRAILEEKEHSKIFGI